MRIASVGTALPPHRYEQAEILASLRLLWRDRPDSLRKLGSFHEHALVRTRHLALPLAEYGRLDTFGAFNDAWIRCAQELGAEAIAQALARARVAPHEVDAIYCTSVTGIASPSLEARLVTRLGLRNDVKRVPLFGLGCVAGAAGIARAAEYVRAFDDQVAVLLSVELCSLTLQKDDLSIPNLIATGLFGDGAAAVVITGERRAERGPRVVATRSVFYPGTEDLMGWSISEHGFRLVLSAGVPAIARERLGADVDAFLAAQGLTRAQVARWICHPGGPKVLTAIRDGLELSDDDLALAWRTLSEQGNLSSASVLMVLEATLRERAPSEGSHALLLAMGPGFCSELVLLRF